MSEFDWLEFKVRPKKDGLHDSGYRFIQLVGATFTEDGGVTKTPLHQWSDHVVLNGPINIDVEADGTIRLMCWTHGEKFTHRGGFYSSAIFGVTDLEKAKRAMESWQ